MLRKSIPLIVAAFALTACGGAPGKAEVQKGLENLAKEVPMLFGSDKPVVKDAKCTKAGNDTYNCVVQLSTSSDPSAMTTNVRLTKLGGQWHAQMTSMPGLGG